MTENFNLFEPSLDVTSPYLPYEDLGIQGVWPRTHKIPADIFPTFAHIGGTNVEKTKVHTASFTDDRRLRVDTGGGGGGGGGATGYGAIGAVSDWQTASSFTFDQRCILNPNVVINKIWRLCYSVGLDRSSCNVGQAIVVQIELVGQPSDTRIYYDTMAFIQNPVGVSENVVDVQKRELLFNNGWSNAPFFSTGDTALWVHFLAQNGGFFPIVCASMDYS